MLDLRTSPRLYPGVRNSIYGSGFVRVFSSAQLPKKTRAVRHQFGPVFAKVLGDGDVPVEPAGANAGAKGLPVMKTNERLLRRTRVAHLLTTRYIL